MSMRLWGSLVVGRKALDPHFQPLAGSVFLKDSTIDVHSKGNLFKLVLLMIKVLFTVSHLSPGKACLFSWFCLELVNVNSCFGMVGSLWCYYYNYPPPSPTPNNIYIYKQISHLLQNTFITCINISTYQTGRIVGMSNIRCGTTRETRRIELTGNSPSEATSEPSARENTTAVLSKFPGT